MSRCDNPECPEEYAGAKPTHSLAGLEFRKVFHPSCCPGEVDGVVCIEQHPVGLRPRPADDYHERLAEHTMDNIEQPMPDPGKVVEHDPWKQLVEGDPGVERCPSCHRLVRFLVEIEEWPEDYLIAMPCCNIRMPLGSLLTEIRFWAENKRKQDPESDPLLYTRYLSMEDLSEAGLLWLISRVVFHPRGYRLGIDTGDGAPQPFFLSYDGEPVCFEPEVDDEKFTAVEQTLANLRNNAGPKQ